MQRYIQRKGGFGTSVIDKKIGNLAVPLWGVKPAIWNTVFDHGGLIELSGEVNLVWWFLFVGSIDWIIEVSWSLLESTAEVRKTWAGISPLLLSFLLRFSRFKGGGSWGFLSWGTHVMVYDWAASPEGWRRGFPCGGKLNFPLKAFNLFHHASHCLGHLVHCFSLPLVQFLQQAYLLMSCHHYWTTPLIRIFFKIVPLWLSHLLIFLNIFFHWRWCCLPLSLMIEHVVWGAEVYIFSSLNCSMRLTR